MTKVSRTESSYIYINELIAFIYITAIAKWCLGLVINKLKTKCELKTSNIERFYSSLVFFLYLSMELYSIKGNSLEQIKRSPFKLEKEIQSIVESNVDDLFVFSITGGLSLKLTTPILDFIGLSSYKSSEVLWENALYFVFRLFVLFPVYQLLLIAVGTLFFQHEFFKNFIKNTLCKLKIISVTSK